MKQIESLIQEMNADIEQLTNMEPEPGCYVVIFLNSGNGTIYALMNGAYNMISKDAQYIMPLPWINQVKRMTRDDANQYAATHVCIENGKGERFFSEVVSIAEYRDILLADQKRVLAAIEKYNNE